MKAILIMFDSLNKQYLPSYNNSCGVIAPHFERLRDQSVTFENSYVSSMPCMPARRELHTGRPNFLHREWGPLEPFDDSMPELLRKSGIYTHLISDHLHYWEDGGTNYHTRYSSWEIVRGQEGDHWKGSVEAPPVPEVEKIPAKQQGTGTSGLWRYDWVNRSYMPNENTQPQTKVFREAGEFIEKNHKADNWFLQIETFDPHEPFYVMENYLKLYEKAYTGKHYDWPRGKADDSPGAVEHIRNQYKALVTMCDRNLGKILDLMDRYGLWEDTMLIVGTDHGFLLGEHQYWGKNLAPYYNEVANTPLFIYDPRFKIQGQRRTSLVQIIDWAPTLLEFFNRDVPGDMTGKSLADTIKEDKAVRTSCIFGVFSGHVNITDGRYVYMRAAIPGKENTINNYTLIPQYMTERFKVEELQKAECVNGFSFTKGLKVLKVPAKDKYKVNSFGNLLFDVSTDPEQHCPLNDGVCEKTMIALLKKHMEKNEAPPEQYERLGI